MFQEKVPLIRYSNYKIGGPARYFFESDKTDDLIAAVQKARRLKIPIFILGGGTNILFSDDGFNGLVLRPDIQLVKKERDFLRVGAGVSITQLLNYLIAKNLSGLEWAGGLPGSLGGAVYGNAGCFGGEMKNNLKEVVSLDISHPSPRIIKRTNSECDFGYRSSIFKKSKGREIILEATLFFERGDKKAIQSVIEQKISYRKERQPLEHPNIGSIFKNVALQGMPKNRQKQFAAVIKTDPFPLIPAAHLISEAGLRGVSRGGAMISAKHPNFIVNALNASAKDVRDLIALVKNKIKEKFSINLEEEIIQV
jgi:UDP-N-acetylmuramate dehydrogenase